MVLLSFEIFGIIWQDIVFAIGGAVGILSKLDALIDGDTVWKRRASIPNAVLYIPTVIAGLTLELYAFSATATISMLIWFGIGIWRAPDNVDNEK